MQLPILKWTGCSHMQIGLCGKPEWGGNITKACAQFDIPLIQISIDYVFDGSEGMSYKPEDESNPIKLYGKSKLAGEEVVRRISAKHLNHPNFQIVFGEWG